MELLHGISEFLQAIGVFGGIGLIILASNKAKIDKMRAEREILQQSFAPRSESTPSELQALKQQLNEMQNTSHQFDLSFDAALNRLEDRMSRVETKVAAVPNAAPQTEEVQPLGRH